MTITLYKNNKPIKSYEDIIKVEPDKKYKYFVIHQKIYHHEIIFIKRFDEVDKIITVEKGRFDTKITKEIIQ